jgi:hypothetical protein
LNKFLALAQLTEDDLNHHAASIATLVWGLNDHLEGDALLRMQALTYRLYAEEQATHEGRGSAPTVDALMLKTFTPDGTPVDAYDEWNEAIPARFRTEIDRLTAEVV